MLILPRTGRWWITKGTGRRQTTEGTGRCRTTEGTGWSGCRYVAIYSGVGVVGLSVRE